MTHFISFFLVPDPAQEQKKIDSICHEKKLNQIDTSLSLSNKFQNLI